MQELHQKENKLRIVRALQVSGAKGAGFGADGGPGGKAGGGSCR